MLYIEETEWTKLKSEFKRLKKELKDKDDLIYFHENHWGKLENQLIDSKAQNSKDTKRINELEHTIKLVLGKLNEVSNIKTNELLLNKIEIQAVDIYS